MPGVPSGRGCEGCRQVKKKCDQQKPACSRCSRLGIQCVGAGVQRYLFVRQQQYSHRQKSQLTSRRSTKSASHSPEEASTALLRMPSNETLHLLSEFVKTICPATNLRYNLAWSYGAFLDDIPKRLGKNAALDASTAALVKSHSAYCVFGKPDFDALSKYSQALTQLRLVLNDPVTARSSETLAAVMMLMTCQTFNGGQNEYWTAHGEGAAEILKARRYYDAQDAFEAKLMMSLRGPVLIEAIFNPRINFSPTEWKTLVQIHLDQDSPEGMMMTCLSKVPEFMRRARDVVRKSRQDEQLLRDMQLERQKLIDVSNDMLEKSRESAKKLQTLELEQSLFMPALFRFERSHGLSITFLVIMTLILSGIDKATSYQNDLEDYAKILWATARNSTSYRPIGAQFASLCLITAWVATDDLQARDAIIQLMCETNLDYPRAHQSGSLVPGLEKASRQLRLLEI